MALCRNRARLPVCWLSGENSPHVSHLTGEGAADGERNPRSYRMADFIPTDLPSCEGVNSMCASSAGRNKVHVLSRARPRDEKAKWLHGRRPVVLVSRAP